MAELHQQSNETVDRAIVVLLALVMFFAPISIAGTQISLGLAVVLWIAKMLWERRLEFVRTPIDPALLGFVGVAVVASAFSLHPVSSFVHLKHLLLASLLYLTISKVHDGPHLHLLAAILIGSASLAAAWGLLRYESGANMKVLATQSTTMTFGALTVMTATLTTSYLLFGKLRWGRIPLVFALVIQAAALSLSYVRGAYVGFAAGLFLLAALKRRRLVIYLVLGFLFVGLFLPRDVLERTASIADLDKPSTQVRLLQWKTAASIFLEHPVLGVGWIDLGEVTRQFARFGSNVPDSVRRDVVGIGHFHNMYIMVLVYFGAVGFLVFLWLLLRIAVKGYRTHLIVKKRDANMDALVSGSLGAIGGFLAAGLFDWTFGDAEVVTVMWIMAAFVFTALRVSTIQDTERGAVAGAATGVQPGSWRDSERIDS